MPFKLAPQPIPDGFHWRCKHVHLTYQGHIPRTALFEAVQRATSTPLTAWSYAHEEAQDPGETETYAHTHFALIFKVALNRSGSRIFDAFYDSDDGSGLPIQVHPHAQPKVSLKQMELIFTDYHAGRKFDLAQGKTVFKKPILHEYKLPPMFQFHRAILEEMRSADTLLDACVVGEVRPRTIADVKLLRDEAASEPKKFKHLFDPSTFKQLGPSSWFILHVWGPTGIGKTKWACAQFKNPLHVKPFNTVGGLEIIKKKFDPTVHDGIICDEADFSFMSREQVIGFFDAEDDFACSVRYTTFEMPPVRKILISNEPPAKLYPQDASGAIARRFQTLHINAPPYYAPGCSSGPSPVTVVRTPMQPILVPNFGNPNSDARMPPMPRFA